jgi:hypothetical protein
MGQEILYCYKCQTRLLGSEFEKGKAFKVGGQASCATCVKDLLGSVPDVGSESERGRKLASTARIALPESSSKIKPLTSRTPAPSHAVPPSRPKTLLIAGVICGVIVLILGFALNSSSSSRRPDPPAPTPAPTPVPVPGPTGRAPDPTPPPAAPGAVAELRDLDEKIRTVSTGEDCRTVAALLDEARKRRASPEWLSEIDLRIGQVVGRARRASVPLREGAIEAQRRSDPAQVKTLRDRILSWGFPDVVDDFDRALAEAAAPTPAPASIAPPNPPPTLPPAPAADPNAPPVLVYTDGLGPGVMDHSWGAVVDRTSTRQVYSGNRAISVAMTRAWGALYLHFDKAVNPDRYPYVAFSVLVAYEKPQISVTLWGAEGGKSTLVGLDKLGGLPKLGTWKRYVIPVAEFNVKDRQIYAIVFQAGKVTPDPLFYVDQIEFLPSSEDRAPPPAPGAAGGKWGAAALKAAARDYDAAAKEMEDPADAELAKLAAQVPAEAAKVIEKWSKGQKVRFEVVVQDGGRQTFEGTVLAADAVRVTLTREDGPIDVPVSEIAPSSLAEIFRGRADKKPQDARAAAAFCAFEGDPDGVKKYSAEGAALPDRYAAFAQARPASEAEVAARRLFWTAEAEFASPRRRTAAIEKYTSLQSSPELARLRPFISTRLDAARETLFLADDLSGAGTFGLAGNSKVDAFWLSSMDSPAAKARENYVEAEFYAFAGAAPKAWVWVGGCCQEVFDASWQASELTAPNPKNPKEPLSCELGAEASLTLKIAASLRKWHAQHGGPKEPARWEWVPLSLPKYETAGPRKLRILTSQQGFAVAAILVTAGARREPPRDSEMKELEKARGPSRRGGGNEPPGNILHELWLNVNGFNVEDLVKSPAFQGKPSVTSLRDAFEGPRDIAEMYGTRMRGFLHPPVTGNYVFWIATDDDGQLFLSTDDTAMKKRLIANCPPAAGFRDWNRWPSCKSAPILLTAGKRYYVEALHKEGNGTDHCSVGWTLPDGTEERPIPGKRLSPWANYPGAGAATVLAAPAAPGPPGTVLYRALALNSPAATIDGRRWEGKGAPDVSTTEGFENQDVPLNPPVADAAKARMIRSSVFSRGSTWVKIEKVPTGTYHVFLYIWEDNNAETMDLLVQGKEVVKGYNSGSAGHWDRLGPWTAVVTNGTLEVRSTGGDANFSGVEIWKTGK